MKIRHMILQGATVTIAVSLFGIALTALYIERGATRDIFFVFSSILGLIAGLVSVEETVSMERRDRHDVE